MKDLTASGLTAEQFTDTLAHWDQSLNAPLHIIACGDAALVLMKLHSALQEADLLIPLQSEYEQLLTILPTLGYRETSDGFCSDASPDIIWRLWPEDTIFGAQLVESPLEEANHTPIMAWKHISLGVLNLKDLIIAQIFQGVPACIDDCIALFKTWQVDAEELLERYARTSKHAERPDDMMHRFMEFVEQLASHQLVSDEVWERIVKSGGGLHKNHQTAV